MKKILYLLLLFLPVSIYATDIDEGNDLINELGLTSKNIILYNLNDDSILYEVNSNDKVQIASITKIMTSIVAIENIDNLDSEITLDYEVFNGLDDYSKAGFKVGDTVTYRELLYGVMLPSGADAVNAIVLNIGGIEKFIGLMNEKAKELGMNNTNFDNAIGMDSDNNYSTASDIAILLKYAIKNKEFYEIFTAREYSIERLNLKLSSTLLKYSKNTTIDVSDILGAKSGFTDGAGLCLASISTLNDVNYLLINLNADYKTTKSNAIKDAVNIFNYYSNNYSYRTIIKDKQVFHTIKNKFGYLDSYDIYATDDKNIYLNNNIDLDKLEYVYDGVEEINYKYNKGDKLGVVSVKYEDRLLDTYQVYLNDSLKYYHPLLYGIIFICVVIFLLLLVKIKKRRKYKRKKRK